MKLGFEESQSAYTSGSQKARGWSEAWVSAWGYCPHCGNGRMTQFSNNKPLADFFCATCNEEFELKSKKGKFGARVIDGAFKTKCERLAASNNPNLLLMNYNVKTLAVADLFIVPKHFFVRDIIEERKPLAPTAKRAGWIGSNILLSRVPESGKIHFVRNGVVRDKDVVLAEWQRTLFLRQESLEARGWLLDVMNCVESLGKREFTLDEMYSFDRHLGELYPGNQNIRPKIRQQLQYLRDRGLIDFVARGNYRLRRRMAWFLNRYRCDRCAKVWTDEWSCTCDDECPRCGARHMTPFASDDLTTFVALIEGAFVVFASPETAEHDPDYRERARFATRAQADRFLETEEHAS